MPPLFTCNIYIVRCISNEVQGAIIGFMAETHDIVITSEKLNQAFDTVRAESDLFTTIVNAPFLQMHVETGLMFLGIIVLLQVDKQAGMVDRVALSNTELAKNTTDVSYVPFSEIRIPLDHSENIIARAIRTGQPQDTTDWKFLFEPALTPEQARINQASGGIAYSMVYPLTAGDGGAVIFSYFQYPSEIGAPQHTFMREYAAIINKKLSQES